MVFVQESMRVANLEQQKVCLQVLSEHIEKEGKKYEELMSKQVSSCKTCQVIRVVRYLRFVIAVLYSPMR